MCRKCVGTKTVTQKNAERPGVCWNGAGLSLPWPIEKNGLPQADIPRRNGASNFFGRMEKK